MKKTKAKSKLLYAVFALLLSAVVVFCGVLWKKVSRMGVILSSFVGPAFYLFWSQILHLSWFSGMGMAVLAAAVVTFGWTWIENVVRGPNKELMEWADPFIDPPDSYDPTTGRD